MDNEEPEKMTCIATFCAGSFWDMESAFRHVNGVVATSVGYMGGAATAANYDEVCTGKTGHSEVVMIAYDPGRITFRELLGIFFRSHDPGRRQQGEYSKNQYEPVIFCQNNQDMLLAEEYIHELLQSGRYKEGIITRVAPASTFYMADECHQQFYEKMGRCYPVLFTGDPGSDEN